MICDGKKVEQISKADWSFYWVGDEEVSRAESLNDLRSVIANYHPLSQSRMAHSFISSVDNTSVIEKVKFRVS